ncbi:MAG: hypothetical protein GXO15_01505 [Crenarchaeota archaeon]|nr:hypothetical protein [Thermoproteota archaeon]
MAQNLVDYRGLGPFLPFGVLERMVRDMGTVTVAVDPGVEPLVMTWAQRRGYYAARRDGVVLISVAPIETESVKPTVEASGKTSAKAVTAVELRVDVENWRSDIAEKLSDVTFIITTVLRAPIVYRGPARGPAFNSAIGVKSGVLLRASIGGQDYFIYVVEGRVLAAAQIGRPLTPKQAESLVQQLKEGGDVVVTVYDASKMF